MQTPQEMERSIRECMADHHVPGEVIDRTAVSHIASKDYPLAIQIRSVTTYPYFRDIITVASQYQFGVLMTSVQYFRINSTGYFVASDTEFDAVKLGWCRPDNITRHIGYFISTRLTKISKEAVPHAYIP